MSAKKHRTPVAAAPAVVASDAPEVVVATPAADAVEAPVADAAPAPTYHISADGDTLAAKQTRQRASKTSGKGKGTDWRTTDGCYEDRGSIRGALVQTLQPLGTFTYAQAMQALRDAKLDFGSSTAPRKFQSCLKAGYIVRGDAPVAAEPAPAEGEEVAAA